MSDDLDSLIPAPVARVGRPLFGLTVLMVEDSRFASEAVRLMCLRSGARIRRADCVAAAHRHLQVYRPQVAIVDLGLPDGAGEDLIAEMVNGHPAVPLVLATSGDDDAEPRAARAGAQGFLQKPLQNLAAFQHAILSRLPDGLAPDGPRDLSGDIVVPDQLALRDDMLHAAEALKSDTDRRVSGYLSQFIGGLARVSDDGRLEQAAKALEDVTDKGAQQRLARLLHTRIAQLSPL